MAKKTDLEQRLDEVTKLHDKGLLNDEEYATRRAAVMAGAGNAPVAVKKGRFPIFKIGCLGVIALVVIIIIAAVATSGGSDKSGTPADTASGTQQSGTNKGDVHVPFAPNASGVIAPQGNGDKKTKVTILQVKDNATSTNQFEKPAAGKKYWAVQVAIENVGTAEVTSVDWKLRDSADNESSQTFASFVGEPLPIAYNLTPGGKTQGWVVFEIPANASPKWLRADPNPFLKNDLYFDFQ